MKRGQPQKMSKKHYQLVEMMKGETKPTEEKEESTQQKIATTTTT
jgi:hypothetical protein